MYLDEELNSKDRQWVRENACVKGRPNMTAQSFCQYANNNFLQSNHLPPYFPRQISIATAICWLHHLGFKHVITKKEFILMVMSVKMSFSIDKNYQNYGNP